MYRYRIYLLSAIFAAIPFAAQAQTQGQDAPANKTAAQTTQKMKDECDTRSDSATGNTASQPQASKEDKTAALADTPKNRNEEIVENSRPAPDGSKVAQTGPAKPVENWFGCPPEKAEDAKPKQ